MADMLVKLYALPNLDEALAASARHGIAVRRALAPERDLVVAWVRAQFPPWAAEVAVAFAREPIACFVALRERRLVGFACHDGVCRNYFGPEGVLESERGRGTGRTLLLATLHAQRGQGYGYAIIGGVGPTAFYEKCVGAEVIPGSTPGIYAGMVRP